MPYDGIFYSEVVVLVIVLIVFLLLSLGGIVLYVIRSIALSRIASRMGKELPWLAWIPLARIYLQGDLAGNITLKKRTITQPGIWLMVLPIAAGVIFFIWYFVFAFATVMSIFWSPDFIANPDTPPVGMIMTIMFSFVLLILIMMVYQGVFYVLRVLINHKIFGQFTTSNMAITHAVLSIFIPMYETICLFVMRNKEFYPASPEIPGNTPTVTSSSPEVPPSRSSVSGEDWS